MNVTKICLNLLLWTALFWLYTRNSDFPFWYHWDEAGKAEQVISGTRNLNHPQLLLNTASILERFVRPGSGDLQHVTNLGRICSAAFSASAVVLLSICAFLLAGRWGYALAALFVALHPRVFELSHFFKEDTALLFGWAAVLCAAGFFGKHRNPKWALVLGVACGLAVSGKYAGLIIALCALIFALLHSRRLAGITLAAMLATFALINFQALLDPGMAVERIQWELHHQLNNETGVSPPWVLAWADLGLAGTLLFAAGILFNLRPAPFRPLFLLALAAQLVYFAALCFITRMVPRYMLIIDVSTWWVIALGLARLLQTPRLRTKPAVFALAFCLVLGVAGWRIQSFQSAWRLFSGEDTRINMALQLDDLAEPGDVLMMDFRVLFPGAYAPQREWHGWVPSVSMRPVAHWSGEWGEDMFATLLEQGVTLVAVAPGYALRYLEAPAHLDFGQFRDVRWRQPFYKRLYAEGTLLLEKTGAAESFLAPHLQLYRIAGPGSRTPAP